MAGARALEAEAAAALETVVFSSSCPSPFFFSCFASCPSSCHSSCVSSSCHSPSSKVALETGREMTRLAWLLSRSHLLLLVHLTQ